ncbi:hypothetical protein C8J57DRAFT_1494235 [Mycena rebaudengoi]|nr:hypothetical protein C8J57DRAFT_1494235 [Mycena rebaudengoi]
MPIKSATRTPTQELENQERAYMRRIQSWNYNDKNRAERNRKKRIRMAALRATDKIVPPEVLATRLEARREASRCYREKNPWKMQAQRRKARGAARAAAATSECG